MPGSLRGLALATTLPAASGSPGTSSPRPYVPGRTQAVAALGTDFFDYLEKHPAEARDFSGGLTSATLWIGDAAQVIDTTGVDLVVDVGGANGSLLHLLLEGNLSLRGIVFDRPNIVDGAVAETARKRASRRRIEVVAVTSSSPSPPADLYLLKMILHDWDDRELHQDSRELPSTQ